MFKRKTTQQMKVEVDPTKLEIEIGALISLHNRTRKGTLADDPPFSGRYPELYRLYLEVCVRGRIGK